MENDDYVKLQHGVLLQESQQLHDNIQRNLSGMQQLLGFALPILTGAFAFALEGKIATEPNVELLYALFSILLSVLLVSFNNLWMQLLTFTRYKYSEVLPKLYALTARQGDNHGQYTVRGGLLRTMLGAAFVQLILLPVAAIAAYQVKFQCCDTGFATPSYLAVVFATLTTIVSWLAANAAVRTIRGTLDPDSSVAK